MPGRDWFSYYAQHFNTLELNVTFYRFPTLRVLQNWYKKAPEGFTFSAKVPRNITHYKKLVNTHQEMQDFYAVLGIGLADKMGCVLFQLPPSFGYSEERLTALLSHINPTFKNVVEFRHSSWFRPDVQAILSDNHISFCGVSFPGIPFDDAVMNTPVSYYRFHGVPKLFYSEYDEAFLQKIHSQLSADSTLTEAFIYFNNTASLAALHNARTFQELVRNGASNP